MLRGADEMPPIEFDTAFTDYQDFQTMPNLDQSKTLD
jgi:hypothetical protein